MILMNKDLKKTGLAIRIATFDDIPLIQNIVSLTWPEAYVKILGEQQVDYMLRKFYSTAALTGQMKDKHIFLIAFLNNQSIAFASFSAVDQRIYKLQKLYVLHSEQKSGAGKAMLQTVEEKVKSLGATKLQLNVNRQNIAKAFYEKNGFAVIEETDIDIGNGYFMNDYIMQKDL